ncbi:metalloregulator ArsR/SmtB family transcription factor [Microbulbifer bruguierae]|uniref:Metalloregulator ArsR/SmtB family transcription factor n=1 Tax=Microbulbifer bruguierae TaxID=3029061 RepID=A0ABY8NF87_9GAMM|nr:metalloregulator ArsR/SmtB family transcription factor [Microbulbifer bruguierae]WGL17350.1 metalloregulator ArsR/SmtB family transcription factor [Microbulbifer bruguierae]
MPDTSDISLDKMHAAASEASSMLRSLGNQDRLLLLCQLSQEELCVSDLEERLDIRQPSLSQQLGVLRREGLVATRKEGKRVYYRVADPKVLSLLQTLYQLYCAE